MFGLMANCFSWLKGRNKPLRDVKLIIIGLDDAGKTTTVACLQGEPPDGITPTIGFSNASLKFGKWNVTLYDLGGGSSVRSVWQKYYAEIYGILFTVDSGNQDCLTESKNVLSEIFEDPKVSGKPIVVFANKQDKEGALDEKEVTEELTLQQLSEKYKFKFNVFPCSAIKGYGKQTDQTINTGILWLLEAINQDYSIINDKVKKESAVQKEIEAIERKARLERIRKLREEREIAAKEAGVGEEEESDDNLMQGNPFRNINDQIEVTSKREKKAKENMKKIKAHQAKQKDIITNETENVEEVPIKKKRKKKKEKNVSESKENENTNNDNENDISLSQNSGVSVESMVAKRRKKKKKKEVTENYEINEVETIDEESEIKLSKKKTTVCNSDDDFCKDLSNMYIKTNVHKKKKTREEDDDDDDGNVVVNTKGTQVIVVSSVESVRPNTPVRKKKTNANASDNAIERDINNSLPHDVKCKKKKKVIRVSDEEEETIKTKQEVVNNSRAELFQVKSYDSLQGSAMLENNTSKQKRRRKKKKEIEKEDNDIPVEKPIRKKKKKNKTAPTLTSSPVHDNESDEDIWNTPPGRNVLPQISQNGHISKLSPIKLRGRLPVIGSENSSVPSWAQARPNSDDLDVMV